MKLVILLGPHAVGKMSVGQELASITGLKLLHNHMTIDLVGNFFDTHGTEEGKRLNALFRQEIFQAVAASNLAGLIFTFMLDFDDPAEHGYIRSIIQLFQAHGAQACVVELCAEYDVRIARNKTENRLQHKPSKRDIEKSEALFRHLESKFRLNSQDNEIPFQNYCKIDNTDLPPDAVARIIQQRFAL